MIRDRPQPVEFLFNYTIKLTLCSAEVSQEGEQTIGA